MGFANSGVIREGADADLILIDMDQPHLVPRHDLAANGVHAARAADVNYAMVDGELLLRKGEFTTLDEEKIMRHAERQAVDLVQGKLYPMQTYRA